MRTPNRKPGKFSQMKQDPLMTQRKFDALVKKLEHLRSERPALAAEVSRLAEHGDFSENAEYQNAKWKLRGLNGAMDRIEYQLANAQIIPKHKHSDSVELGCTVTVEVGGKQKTYEILGSSETNPGRGVISHNSPIGVALMGHEVGDTVVVKLADKEVEYKIINIE